MTLPDAELRTSDVLLEVRGLRKSYGRRGHQTEAIEQIDLSVREKEFVSVVGPSGCGKTTLLKCIAGLLTPSAGGTWLRREHVTGPPPDLAVVFQDYSRSLFPWLTVRKNVTLPLRSRRDVADRNKAVATSLSAVGLEQFAEHYPWQLSGGMQQRVAIARALAYQPKLLLMDEPFASVDAQTRSELEDLVLRVWGEFNMTVLHVTHDIDEAIYLADRVFVLGGPPSRVKQVISVDLPRPRGQLETKNRSEFAAIRTEVYHAIRGLRSSAAVP